ncbi:ABC transporter ATP-binding protein [Nocardiopsis gilva YIM 90087]|uniref:ABC transporter ATP-binding protein n=1 Tax=Nocardiopsis gilva YIM 90087 TaxID=1235441 RepID=A0A223S3X3_9ACTN|nr:ABC transporter ATP-binding protein [Nocardiopsis gilva]ASU82830.1 ABC transporter ATP-binding protein [Nocardiopsis gilva YIM 90087]
MIRLKGVVRHYGPNHAIGPIDLEVGPGESVVLIGPNGCGKSTMLRVAAGLETYDSGSVNVLGGEPQQDSPDFRRRVFVLDELAFFPDLSVREHLELIAVGHGLGNKAARRVDAVLARCRLSLHGDLSPRQLSKGLQQLLLIASMLVPPSPDLMILDEPERHLDEDARSWLGEELVQKKLEGTGLLVATHHRPLVEALGDRVVDFGGGGPVGSEGAE